MLAYVSELTVRQFAHWPTNYAHTRTQSHSTVCNGCVSQLIDYYYDADETWMVWPPDLSVETFSGLAPSIFDQIISVSLYKPILGYIKEAKNEIVNDLQEFQTTLQNLTNGLQSYNTTINSDVPR
jgi:hypothetical protein